MTKSIVMYVAIGDLPEKKAQDLVQRHKEIWDNYRNKHGLGPAPILFIPVRKQDTSLEVFEI